MELCAGLTGPVPRQTSGPLDGLEEVIDDILDPLTDPPDSGKIEIGVEVSAGLTPVGKED